MPLWTLPHAATCKHEFGTCSSWAECIGTHDIGLQRNGSRAALLALDACYGLGMDNFLHYADHVAAVTAEDVRSVARRVIDFNHSALAIVGP